MSLKYKIGNDAVEVMTLHELMTEMIGCEPELEYLISSDLPDHQVIYDQTWVMRVLDALKFMVAHDPNEVDPYFFGLVRQKTVNTAYFFCKFDIYIRSHQEMVLRWKQSTEKDWLTLRVSADEFLALSKLLFRPEDLLLYNHYQAFLVTV